MRRSLTAVVAALSLAVMLALPAAGATPPATTYHGTWDAANACGHVYVASGVWNVNLKDDGTATVTARIFSDGRPHAAWGGNYFWTPWMQMAPGSDTFSVLNAPWGLSFVLGADGTLTYTLIEYCEDGSDAFLWGHLTD